MQEQYLIEDVLLGCSPQDLHDNRFKGISLAMAIGLIEDTAPPAAHPVRLNPKKQHQTIEICKESTYMFIYAQFASSFTFICAIPLLPL